MSWDCIVAPDCAILMNIPYSYLPLFGRTPQIRRPNEKRMKIVIILLRPHWQIFTLNYVLMNEPSLEEFIPPANSRLTCAEDFCASSFALSALFMPYLISRSHN